jgi:hypothetical protein
MARVQSWRRSACRSVWPPTACRDSGRFGYYNRISGIRISGIASAATCSTGHFSRRYIFARLDWEAAGVSDVKWTPGLTRVVTFQGEPAIMPD